MTEEKTTHSLAEFQQALESITEEEMPLLDYLEACKSDPSLYLSPAGRLLKATGEPTLIDTREDERLGRIFENRTIRLYKAFDDFYGIETAIENLISFFNRAEQGLHERKKILYLLGPVGGGKSSLVTRLMQLMEEEPIYVLRVKTGVDLPRHAPAISPVFESPLALFAAQKTRHKFAEQFNVPNHRIPTVMSPWASTRLRELKNDLSKFSVVRMYPSLLNRAALAITEAGDDNNQDISDLVGKTSISKLDEKEQHESDAYSYSGGLNRASQGMLEFREMFKAPRKTLLPLLFATQDGHYQATEGLPSIPFDGIVIAHSNESEWQKFRNDKGNEAMIDRINLVKVPYTLRYSEEEKIYQKMIAEGGSLKNAPCAPKTLEILARFSVLTRMSDPGMVDSTWSSKLRVYNGEDLKDQDAKAKTIREYRDAAGVNEGMSGMSTRFAFQVLGETFNYDTKEVSVNPVHLLYVLQERIRHSDLPEEKQELYIGEFVKGILAQEYSEFLAKELQSALVESFDTYGQALLERYIKFADHWCENKAFRDPDTGENYDRESLNEWLEEIEKPAGKANPREFREEIVKFALRKRAENEGRLPGWKKIDEKFREVIEKKVFADIENLMPVMSFGAKKSEKEKEEHQKFIDRMIEKGYSTERMVRILVDWHQQVRKRS